MADNQEQFLYDEFFSDETTGLDVTVTIKNREVPLKVKSGLSADDRESAQTVGIKRTFDYAKGTVKVDSVDEAAMGYEMLARFVISWPFTYKDGSPVPINRQTVEKLLATGVDELTALFQRINGAKDLAVEGPFVTPSTEA